MRIKYCQAHPSYKHVHLSCPAAAAAVLPAHFFDVNMDGEAREEGHIYAVAMGNKFGLFESAELSRANDHCHKD